MKVTISSFWIGILVVTSFHQEAIPYPAGLCKFFNCSILVSSYTYPLLLAFAIIFSLLYILEKWMRATTLCMFLISLIFFTLEESNGILNYNGLYTMLFLAQFIAYFRNNANLKTERVQFPIQIIAAGYTLAGIAKLKESGLNWVMEAPQASIQVLKNYCYAYFDTGNVYFLDKGTRFANFVMENQFFVKTLFAFSLFLELFALIAVRNKASAFIYGILLTAMHIGIFYFMHILIFSIFIPMITFFVNPVGLLGILIANLLKKDSLRGKLVT